MHLETWQWVLAGIGAFGIGVSKTGLPGMGILAVSLFAVIFDPVASVGIVLPLLISADVAAVVSYRRHADWKELRRIFPWAGAGIILGWRLVDLLQGSNGKVLIEKVIGIILLAMVALHVWRKRHPKEEDVPHHKLWAPSMGILAGFTTMIANAAGPVMTLYLLAANLPKMAFMGTTAWYFCLLNLFKVPFSVQLGQINAAAMQVDAVLAPLAVIGSLCGRALLPKINQTVFELLALIFAGIAGVKLLVWDLLLGRF